MKCPKCGNEAQEDAIFCDQCGQRLAGLEAPLDAGPAITTMAEAVTAVTMATPEDGVCAQCGARNTPGEAFCGECGAPLEAPLPAPASPVTTSPATSSPAISLPKALKGGLCPACGAQLEAGDAFCFACGAALPTEAAPAPLVAPPSAASELQVEAPRPAAPLADADECPSCGAKVKPGDAFCDYCGAALGQATAGAPSVAPKNLAPGTVGPRLVVEAAHAEIALSEGAEVLLGREDPVANVYPDVDLTPYGAEEAGVSRRHCKITLAEGRYAIQDLGSTNGTLVNRAKLQPSMPVALKDGDEIRVGRLRLVFRVGA